MTKAEKLERVTGHIFLDGFFTEQKDWIEQPPEEFWGNLDKIRCTYGKANYTTRQNVRMNFDLASNHGVCDVAMRKDDETGLYHAIYPRKDDGTAKQFTVNLVEDLPFSTQNSNPRIRYN